MMRLIICAFWSISMTFGSLAGSAEQERFIKSNILAVFYHELGHAVIDVEDLPIFGQEEDAADVFSVFMMHELFAEDVARELAYDAAQGFLAEAEFEERTGEEELWSGTHGSSEQRFFNSVCIFYGAAPYQRADFAADLGLPEDRAETCQEEFDQANHSWGGVLDDMMDRGRGDSLRFVSDGAKSRAAELLTHEAAYLNQMLQLAQPVRIVVEPCGEANAYYSPDDREILFCDEFERYFEDMARWLF